MTAAAVLRIVALAGVAASGTLSRQQVSAQVVAPHAHPSASLVASIMAARRGRG